MVAALIRTETVKGRDTKGLKATTQASKASGKAGYTAQSSISALKKNRTL